MSILGYDDMFAWIGHRCEVCGGEGSLGLGGISECYECEGSGFDAFLAYTEPEDGDLIRVYFYRRWDGEDVGWGGNVMARSIAHMLWDRQHKDLHELVDAAAEFVDDRYGPCVPAPYGIRRPIMSGESGGWVVL